MINGEEETFVWRVTLYEDKPIDVVAGLSFPQDVDDIVKMQAIGHMMVTIGKRLEHCKLDEAEPDE